MAAEERHTLVYRGSLVGHGKGAWVTALKTTKDNPDMLYSAGRDKKVIQWLVTRDEGNFGTPVLSVGGHGHYIEDIDVSGSYVLSASCDKTLRLVQMTNQAEREPTRKFVGHTNDVLTCAFDPARRFVVSGGRDSSLCIWNNRGECKVRTTNIHTGWISKVRMTPLIDDKSYVVTASHDGLVKVFDLNTMKTVRSFEGHEGYISALDISPDSSFIASGSRDGKVIVWNFATDKETTGNSVYQRVEVGGLVNDIVFCPTRYWMAIAYGDLVRVYDLPSSAVIVDLDYTTASEVSEGTRQAKKARALSLAWSVQGNILFAGYSDGEIRAYEVTQAQDV